MQLPAEIRNKIWGYALGDTMIQAYFVRLQTSKLRLRPTDRKYAMALLRTCRQIYHETAILPYKLNTITVSFLQDVAAIVKILRPYQYRHVTTLQIELYGTRWKYAGQKWELLAQWESFHKLSSLLNVHVRVYRDEDEDEDEPDEETADSCPDVVRALQTTLPGQRVSWEVCNMKWYQYQDQWAY